MSRFRLYPSALQEAVLSAHCGHARFVWNLAVEQQLWWRRGRGAAPGYVAQARQLTEARAENPWLAAGSQTVQQQALRDFDQAMKFFYAGTHRKPAWRKAGRSEGFRIVGSQAVKVRRVSRRVGEVWVPKAGWVRFRWSRHVPAAKSYRVTCDRSGRWHIGFAAVPASTPIPGNGKSVGVDRGVAVSAALSTGELLNVPGLRPTEVVRLLWLKRRLAKAMKGSTRRGRLKAQIARLIARQTDRRKNWVEQTSTTLVRDFDLIAIENLPIKAMTRSAKGTIEEPGVNVAAKTGRGILANGWGQLAQRLEDKAPGRVVRVNPAYTSQRCNACGTVDEKSRENQADFQCTACGHTDNADVNAARNVLDRATEGPDYDGITADGRAVAARGDGVCPSQSREPQLELASL